MLDIRDYERYEAEQTLLSELDYGKQSAKKQGTLSTDEVKAVFATRFK